MSLAEVWSVIGSMGPGGTAVAAFLELFVILWLVRVNNKQADIITSQNKVIYDIQETRIAETRELVRVLETNKNATEHATTVLTGLSTAVSNLQQLFMRGRKD
jgi:hypothetical protein